MLIEFLLIITLVILVIILLDQRKLKFEFTELKKVLEEVNLEQRRVKYFKFAL